MSPSTRYTFTLALVALLAVSWLGSALSASAAAAATSDDDDEGLSPLASSRSGGDAGEGEPAELAVFSVYDYLQGDWDLYRHVVLPDGAISYSHSLPAVRWHLEKDNTSSARALIGSALANGSSADEALFLRVEFDEGLLAGSLSSSGRLSSGVDEDHLNPLFSFSFSQMKGSVPVSAGPWRGADVSRGGALDAGARYLMQAATPDRFTLYVTPGAQAAAAAAAGKQQQAAEEEEGKQKGQKGATKAAKAADAEDDDDLHTAGPALTGHALLSAGDAPAGSGLLYVAHRWRPEENKTFFQKYGTMVMLGAMLILNIYMRSKQATPASQAARRAAPPPTSAAAIRARNAAAQGARIEEITEGEIDVGGAKKEK